jgi:hypothetical protein
MVSQLLKREGKRAWRSERVVRVTPGGGAAGGAADGVALTVGLKLVVVVSLLFFPLCTVLCGRKLPGTLEALQQHGAHGESGGVCDECKRLGWVDVCQ